VRQNTRTNYYHPILVVVADEFILRDVSAPSVTAENRAQLVHTW